MRRWPRWRRADPVATPPPLRSKGYLMCDGIRFEITDMWLGAGEWQVRAVGFVGARSEVLGPITAFGADGVGCWQGGDNFRLHVGPGHDWATITASMRMDRVVDRAGKGGGA